MGGKGLAGESGGGCVCVRQSEGLGEWGEEGMGRRDGEGT